MVSQVSPTPNSRYVRESVFLIPKLHAEDIGGYDGGIFFGTLVIASQVLWELLVEMEHEISHFVSADDCAGPELLHEEHLVCEVGGRTCGRWEGGGQC